MTNKKIFLIGFLLLAGFAFNLKAQTTKIGFTNVELILAFMPEAKAADQKIQTYGQQLQKSLAIKEEYFRTKMGEYYEKAQTNGFKSEDEKKAAETELQKLEAEIQASAEESEYRLLAKQQELMEPILTKLQNKIDEIAKAEGFTYILNQTSGMNILYGVESLDITEKLAAKLGVTLPKKE